MDTMDTNEIACQFAQQRYKNIALWRNLWTILIFAFGVVVVVFLVMAIVFLIRQDWLPGGLNVLGTIVDGVAIGWVLARRNQAVEEEKDALAEIKELCGDKITVEHYTDKLRLIGKLR
jgi:hypothetical protein